MSCSNRNKTLTFDEKVKGWTSFHSFIPDYMIGMNNKFFTFNNGELYEHHSDNVPRNYYYDKQYNSSIGVMVNDSPSEIKELQALSLEGNKAWEAKIKSFVSNSDDYMESSIDDVEWVQKEGIWFAYARRNETELNFDSKATYGIGSVGEVLTDYTLNVNGWSTSLCVGDILMRGSDLSVLGTITSLNANDKIITVDSTLTLEVGDFLVGVKDARVEGGNLRGYTMRVDLTNDSTEKVELYAVNLEVAKSFS